MKQEEEDRQRERAEMEDLREQMLNEEHKEKERKEKEGAARKQRELRLMFLEAEKQDKYYKQLKREEEDMIERDFKRWVLAALWFGRLPSK